MSLFSDEDLPISVPEQSMRDKPKLNPSLSDVSLSPEEQFAITTRKPIITHQSIVPTRTLTTQTPDISILNQFAKTLTGYGDKLSRDIIKDVFGFTSDVFNSKHVRNNFVNNEYIRQYNKYKQTDNKYINVLTEYNNTKPSKQKPGTSTRGGTRGRKKITTTPIGNIDDINAGYQTEEFFAIMPRQRNQDVYNRITEYMGYYSTDLINAYGLNSPQYEGGLFLYRKLIEQENICPILYYAIFSVLPIPSKSNIQSIESPQVKSGASNSFRFKQFSYVNLNGQTITISNKNITGLKSLLYYIYHKYSYKLTTFHKKVTVYDHNENTFIEVPLEGIEDDGSAITENTFKDTIILNNPNICIAKGYYVYIYIYVIVLLNNRLNISQDGDAERIKNELYKFYTYLMFRQFV